MTSEIESTREKLDGLMRFAHGVLTARDKVQRTMSFGNLGVYHESEIRTWSGVLLDDQTGAWLRLTRLYEGKPPSPDDHVATFLASRGDDPAKPPELHAAVSIQVTIDEASELADAGLLRADNVRPSIENGEEVDDHVQVTLLADDCNEMKRAFNAWRDGEWAVWAREEKPVREAIRAYKSLFQLHSAIHASESTPPEIVWGIGIGRWKTGSHEIDMPLIEQLVDIEVEEDGAIVIRPRDLAPTLSLRPYIDIEVPGAPKLQQQLLEALGAILEGDDEFSPFQVLGWEHILAAAAAQLSPDAVHLTSEELGDSVALKPTSEQLTIASSWAIYGRARSTTAQSRDMEALRDALIDPETPIPASIEGFVAPKPDEQQSEADPFGLNTSVLQAGLGESAWTSANRDAASANDLEEDRRPTRFFPLPFNEDQSKIIESLDDLKNHVVTVTGPPGTGKTHTIANIVGHYMATGRRVLVTARTAEAIAAVREKLPESLRHLAIASVGTDRECAEQLREAISELSDEVVRLNIAETDERRRRLESLIVTCDQEVQAADRGLADIARANLMPLTWHGEKQTAMELVEDLEKLRERYGWFTDRPHDQPPSYLAEVLERLKETLPAIAPDIAYAGVSLPDPSSLPTTQELIDAHEQELAWQTRKKPDFENAPPMARDDADADTLAQLLLDELKSLAGEISNLSDCQKHIVKRLTERGEPPADNIDETALRQAVESIKAINPDGTAEAVRFELGPAAIEEMLVAATRGAAGQKPVSFMSGFFNAALKEALLSITIDQRPPSDRSDWRSVHSACRLQAERAEIETGLAPLLSAILLPPLPASGWEIARYLKEAAQEIDIAVELAPRIDAAALGIEKLFPVGLNIDAFRQALRTDEAIEALRANLPEDHETPATLTQLSNLASGGDQEIFLSLQSLRSSLGANSIEREDIVRMRSELTAELNRIVGITDQLSGLERDLEMLSATGAVEWAERLRNQPLDASKLISEEWQEAWAWASMKARVDRIIDLGNGDQHRHAKADAMARRRKSFEELIRVRTLLGLNQRMSGSVKRSLHAFTEAVVKIGKGTGKSAPRYQNAAQKAAKEASQAIPVWIMPEYRVSEQLPSRIGDFDLVILDEASQSNISALSALFRGQSILIVGDEEQVSPSDVGIEVQRISQLRAEYLGDLPNADLIDEKTSIFEIARRMHPETHTVLKEHFRCAAPIIQFSTRFYANRLVPLRVPKASERFDPPLVDVHIVGAERRGKTNNAEARFIVDEIVKIVEDPEHDERDIGVISLLGAEQAENINRMLINHPKIGTDVIRKRGLICGDARTLQGQERSIVFLSMVAAGEKVQSQSSRPFRQRMNVAMSRARDRLYLVRSLEAGELKAGDIKLEVLQHFQNPMPEGRSAFSSGTTKDLFARCESGFEREVLRLLLEANYRVRPQVKVGAFSIDLVVEGTNDKRLAIELDGDAYHGPDVWDRDMARQASLERAG
ncbi:MAG: AAA domain-containing protein [Pseudomonadota bacterium]